MEAAHQHGSHFSDDLLAAVHANLRDEHGFAVSQMQVTAIGLCRNCQAAAAVVSAGLADPAATAERDAATDLPGDEQRESALSRPALKS